MKCKNVDLKRTAIHSRLKPVDNPSVDRDFVFVLRELVSIARLPATVIRADAKYPVQVQLQHNPVAGEPYCGYSTSIAPIESLSTRSDKYSFIPTGHSQNIPARTLSSALR